MRTYERFPRKHGPLSKVDEMLSESLEQVRKTSYDLCPPILYDVGLSAALEWLVEQTKQRYGIAVSFSDRADEGALCDATKVIIFRSVSELLQNVGKHAQATRATLATGRNRDFKSR